MPPSRFVGKIKCANVDKMLSRVPGTQHLQGQGQKERTAVKEGLAKGGSKDGRI